MALVLDTGVLYAALDGADPAHRPCASLLRATTETLVIPTMVLGELDYWVHKFAPEPAWTAFCESIADGAFTLYPLDAVGLCEAAALQANYADLAIGLVDASVAVACEQLGERKVATLDRRLFSVLRTRTGDALTLLP